MTNKLKNLKNSNKCNIRCQWMKTNRIIVNPDGQVVPCCFFANMLFIGKTHNYPNDYPEATKEEYDLDYQVAYIPKVATRAVEDPILRQYVENEDDMNLRTNSMQDIVNHEWYTKTLPESWDDPTKVSSVCVKHCTKK